MGRYGKSLGNTQSKKSNFKGGDREK